MIEFLFCALFTILPDYLYRRYRQGLRFGKEITFFTVWYILRWGISSCVLLTILLLTMIFYFHPTTKDVVMAFRTLTILPETPGRVASVNVENHDHIKAGDIIFTLENHTQKAAVVAAQTRLAEVKAEIKVAGADLRSAEFRVDNSEASLEFAEIELQRVEDLTARGSSAVSERDMDQMRSRVDSLEAALSEAKSAVVRAQAQLDTVLPARLESANASLTQAKVELDKTIIRAGVDGQVTQFVLEVGDYINPILRPAGLLLPKDGIDGMAIQAGFPQVTAQVVKPGVLTELSCISLPLTVVPMVVTDVQQGIAAGQIRPTDQLVDPIQRARPGSLTVRMEPLWKDFPGMENIIPGTKCIANAYTNNHDRIASGELTSMQALGLHAVDATGIVHALILRIQTLLLPIQLLILTGH